MPANDASVVCTCASCAVADAKEAINVMGLIKVRALVIAASFGEGFHCVGSVNMNQLWRYSLNSANLARYIALPIRIDESTAFTSGQPGTIIHRRSHGAACCMRGWRWQW